MSFGHESPTSVKLTPEQEALIDSAPIELGAGKSTGPTAPEATTVCGVTMGPRRSTRPRKRATQAGGYAGFELDTAHQSQLAIREAKDHNRILFVGTDKHGGRGLFARTEVSMNCTALYYRGELFLSRQAHERAFPGGSVFAMMTKGGEVWDATKVLCVARFINHAPEAEANVRMCGIQHTNVIELELKRNIKQGEELCMCYGKDFDYRKFKPMASSPVKYERLEESEIDEWLESVGMTTAVMLEIEEEVDAVDAAWSQVTEHHSRPPRVSHTCKTVNKNSAPTDWCPPGEHDTKRMRTGKVREPSQLRAADGLVRRFDDYVEDWSKWDIDAQAHPHLASFLDDKDLVNNALARDSPEDERIMASQANDADWIVNASKAEWAWGSNIVPIGFVKEEGEMVEQQVYLDTVRFPRSVYHYRTRSGRAGVNELIMGSFVITEFDANGKFYRCPRGGHPPLLQLDSSLGVRLAGNVIKGKWVDAHHFIWRDLPIILVKPRYANGDIYMDPEGAGGTGLVWGAIKKNAEIAWRFQRGRSVGGPGGLPTFSPKRKIAGDPTDAHLLCFPVANREDYCLAKHVPTCGPRHRATFESWHQVFRGDRYTKVQAWIKRSATHLKMCEVYCIEKEVRCIPDEAYALICRQYRPPKVLLMNDSDLIHQCKGMRLFRQENGTIIQKFDDEGPLMPSALKPEAVAAEQSNTPWDNARMFQNLIQGGLTPLAHDKGNSIVLRPYDKKLYQCAIIWKEERDKGTSKESLCTMFTPPSMELASIPIIIAARSHVPKADSDDWRQILVMSRHVSDESRTVAPSLNSRLRASRSLEQPIPNMEMCKGTDVATTIAIFQSFGLVVKVYTFDASQFFHCVNVGFMQSTEQGLVGTEGFQLSTVYDMGREDSPRCTGQLSSFFAEAVGKHVHNEIMKGDHGRGSNLNEKARFMFATRAKHFGPESRQCRLAQTYMFVDDLAIVTIVGTMEGSIDDSVKDTVMTKAGAMGLVFKAEKFGESIFIGQRYFITGTFSTQHIKPSKLAKYVESWEEITHLHQISDKVHDQLTGRLTYAATVHLELKAVAAIVNDCRYATHRLHTGLSPFSPMARSAVRYAIDVLKADKGLPLLPTCTFPKHDAESTITIRGDAALNEEGVNGWGFWILVPQPDGAPPIIYVCGDEWSAEEQEKLGRDVPMAECLALIFETRLMASRNIAQPMHKATLQVTDSGSCKFKFGSLRAGSVRLDGARAHWQKIQEDNPLRVPPCWVSHAAREFNTVADMASKGRWSLLQATLKAAGLPKATRLYLSKEDRYVIDLLDATRTF